MTASKGTVAFFGATGGCAATVLALALQNGYTCSALARTPSKLTNILTKEHSISAEIKSSLLTIVKGDAKDAKAVKAVLAPNNVPASIVIFGIGSSPKLQWSIMEPVTLHDPTICADTMATLFSALGDLRAEGIITEQTRPRLVAISTTGTDKKTRDVPWGYYALYHWLLAVPHKDKRIMESVIARATTASEAESLIANFTIARPTLLIDGESKGVEKVNAGWMPHPEAVNATAKGGKPAMGYTMRRADVGAWIFERCVKGESQGWENKCASLAYGPAPQFTML